MRNKTDAIIAYTSNNPVYDCGLLLFAALWYCSTDVCVWRWWNEGNYIIMSIVKKINKKKPQWPRRMRARRKNIVSRDRRIIRRLLQRI